MNYRFPSSKRQAQLRLGTPLLASHTAVNELSVNKACELQILPKVSRSTKTTFAAVQQSIVFRDSSPDQT